MGGSARLLLRFNLPASDHGQLSWEAGFDSDIGGDVPDWDNTESRESDEDAAWRELVARFEEPATTTEPVPWPEREDVAGSHPHAAQGAEGTDGASGVHEVDGGRETPNSQGLLGTGEAQDAGGASGSKGRSEDSGSREARGTSADGDLDETEGTHGDSTPLGTPEPEATLGTTGTRGVDGIRGFDDEGVRRAFDGDAQPGTHEPDVIQAAGRDRRTVAHGTRARRIRARKAPPRPGPEHDEEHFIPPAPPPLPTLDPIAKGAWVALFGGPGYLVVATAAGWSVSGIAAFCAVAAFVTGFAILVLRMNEPSGPGPGGPDDGDDGAVV